MTSVASAVKRVSLGTVGAHERNTSPPGSQGPAVLRGRKRQTGQGKAWTKAQGKRMGA